MRLALVGDVHLRWGPTDVRQLDASGYDGVLVTGDLPNRRHQHTLRVARGIAALRTPVVAIPGNHDGTAVIQVAVETLGILQNLPLVARLQARRLRELEAAYHPHTLGGYSLHPLGDGPDAIEVLVARPHAMDGRHLTFRAFLRDRYGVDSLEDSARRLCALVDQATRPLVVLCHNGPHGLGVQGPWGLPRLGRDNGDRDLTEALAHARATGKRVLAVCGGHAHHGRRRAWKVEQDGVLYVNAARVPRVFERDGQTWRHHVRLDFDGEAITAEPVLLPDPR